MNVLHLLDSPNRGGTEILELDFCRNAKTFGLDVTLVVTSKGDLFDEFKSSGVDFQYFERKMPIDFRLIHYLLKFIKEKKIDVIHTHQAVDGLHAYLAGRTAKIKKVMSFHGHVPSFKDDLVLKNLIPRMDLNIAVSRSFLIRLREEIGFNTNKNFRVVYNGIDQKKFYETEKEFRKELKPGDSDILLGMIGNFYNNGRNPITICRALPDLFKRFSNLHFVFVGGRSEKNPEYFDECYEFCEKNEILDKTYFVGVRSDINDILNSLDIFVYSSNYDTFGIAVIEAMFAGLPIIINDIPPLLEITDNGKYASVYRSKSSKDLSEKITDAINSIEEKKRSAGEIKNWAVKKYGIENYIAELKLVYNSLM